MTLVETVNRSKTKNMDFHALFEKMFHEALRLLPGSLVVAEEFCHYTSLQGLIGIVESNEIWLSDHRFVNDKLEYEYGKELALSTIAEMVGPEGNSEFGAFLQNLMSSIQKPSSRGIYIGSMSLSPDRLDQWKGYGNTSESICVRFAGDFKLWNAQNSHPSHIRQRKVIYRQDEQTRLIRAILQIFKNSFNEFRTFDYPFLDDLTWLIESQLIFLSTQSMPRRMSYV